MVTSSGMHFAEVIAKVYGKGVTKILLAVSAFFEECIRI